MKRLFPQKDGRRIILGEGYPYLERFMESSDDCPNRPSAIEGIGLSVSKPYVREVVYQIKLPALKKWAAYRLVLEPLPKNWKSPLLLLAVLPLILAIPALADNSDWWTQNAIEQAAQTQAHATAQAAQIQAAAMDRQTQALKDQTMNADTNAWAANFDANIASRNAYTIELGKLMIEAEKIRLAKESQCQYRLLVKDLKTMEPERLPNGVGPLYFKDCTVKPQ